GPTVLRLNIGLRSPSPVRIVLALPDRREGVTVQEDAFKVSTESRENLNPVSVRQEMMQNLPVFDQGHVATMSRFLNSGLAREASLWSWMEWNPRAFERLQARSGWSRSTRTRIRRSSRAPEEAVSRSSPNLAPRINHGTVNFIFRDYRLNAR